MQVRDLGNLIGLYTEWHSRLLPYYSFDHFVHKVEQVAATKRVKVSDLVISLPLNFWSHWNLLQIFILFLLISSRWLLENWEKEWPEEETQQSCMNHQLLTKTFQMMNRVCSFFLCMIRDIFSRTWVVPSTFGECYVVESFVIFSCFKLRFLLFKAFILSLHSLVRSSKVIYFSVLDPTVH